MSPVATSVFKMTENLAEKSLDIKNNLIIVLEKIHAACGKRSTDLPQIRPTLVAVSKIQPVEKIITAYELGQRHFGENYVQEIIDKATNSQILDKCKEIKWHFIGHLQSNKINKILAIPNLYMIETIDSLKLASSVSEHWKKFAPTEDSKLKVMIQVNTSAEDNKNGVQETDILPLAEHIRKECPNLILEGLMTIGKYGWDPTAGQNPDFLKLRKYRENLCKQLNVKQEEVRLSMGMSDDFEQAIELGSTVIRVGSSIFGARPKKN